MRTITKTTIRNATKQQLLDYIADLSQDLPYDQTIEGLRRKAKECENKSRRWFGGKITFEEWADS